MEKCPGHGVPEFKDSKGFQQPVLLLEIDHTATNPFSQLNLAISGRRWKRNSTSAKRKLRRSSQGAGLSHGSFSDYPLYAANGDAEKTEVALHNLSLTQRFTRASRQVSEERERAIAG